MNREPLLINRNPIISRTAIYRRVAMFDKPALYEGCKLCKSLYDCSGNKFVEKCSDEPKELYRVIHVGKNFTDWNSLELDIWSISNTSCYLRLIIDKEIPDRILWAASFSEKNILQVNVNMLRLKSDFSWVKKLAYMSGNCGLYNVMFLYPIIPELIKTYHVINVMDSFKNSGHHHTTIKFGKIYGCKEAGEYINFNGFPVPTKHLQRIEDGWECTEEYSELFLSKVNIFAVPRNLSVSVCKENVDCTGLGG